MEVNKQEKLARLLKKYFRLYSQEIITANPAFKGYETPGITKELNSLENEIWALKKEMDSNINLEEFTNMDKKWSSKFPTKEDAGKWFFVKFDPKDGSESVIRIKKVRVDTSGELYLCPESDFGIHKDTLGVNISLYKPQFTQFIGPIWTPLSEGG